MGTSQSCPTQFRKENIKTTIFGYNSWSDYRQQKRYCNTSMASSTPYQNTSTKCSNCYGSGRTGSCSCGDYDCSSTCRKCGGSGRA
jgi:hypothetical protein